MYKVLNDFVEKEHKNTLYVKGDSYPKSGFISNPERVSFLQSNKNKYNKVFLGSEEAEKKKSSKKKK